MYVHCTNLGHVTQDHFNTFVPYTKEESGIHHTRMHCNHSLTDPVVSIALYRKMQSFGATLNFDPHFSRLMG